MNHVHCNRESNNNSNDNNVIVNNMGNSFSNVIGNSQTLRNKSHHPKLRKHFLQQQQQQQQQKHYHHQYHQHKHSHDLLCQQHESKSKTLPARHLRERHNRRRSRTVERINDPNTTSSGTAAQPPPPPPPPAAETSRLLFLLYLIHRTWNVVIDTMDNRSKRSRRSAAAPSVDSGAPPTNSLFEEMNNSCCEDVGCNFSSVTVTDLEDLNEFEDVADKLTSSTFCDSIYSYCSCCCDCCDGSQNIYNSIEENCSNIAATLNGDTISQIDSELSDFYHGYEMAPSICGNSRDIASHNKAASSPTASTTQKSHFGTSSLDGSLTSYNMTNSENSWPHTVFSKENQRPPVYNPEDYALKLKKFGKRQRGTNIQSIYDRDAEISTEEPNRSSTLPIKQSGYKSPIPTPPESDSEMSLRQFASITDLLTKLRADLRVSFPSFVQEFVGSPIDGVSALLEVLRAIQLSQNTNSPKSSLVTAQMSTGSMPRTTQSYQRRALLDELACLQCLSICCSRSLEATARLGTTPVGLMPLASSATGQGIRARILAMQLMSAACDKQIIGNSSTKNTSSGHTAVSEAMSTLRLRCSEPVRFRLLVGMLNSGGGSGELQAVGVKFINTFLESAENLQQRLYLQAELFQAGFEPTALVKTISSSSPWLDALRNEIKRFNELRIDVDKMLTQVRDADRVRSQMVILERRVQILHEEKAVLTSMERRLQERCAELQREIFRLQGTHNENNFKSLDKQKPVVLPRHVPPVMPDSKQDSSEHEDEGISSSETGPSLSPVPILVLPQNSPNATKLQPNQKYKHKRSTNAASNGAASKNSEKNSKTNGNKDASLDAADDIAIDDVMEELENIVIEAERQISIEQQITESLPPRDCPIKEEKIIPVNIVPQPPRKSRPLNHLLSHDVGSDLDGSEYGMLLMQHQADQAVERVTMLQTFFDETDYDAFENRDKPFTMDGITDDDIPEINANPEYTQPSTTRQLLDVIMNARQSEDDPTMKALREDAALVHTDNIPNGMPMGAASTTTTALATAAAPPPTIEQRQQQQHNQARGKRRNSFSKVEAAMAGINAVDMTAQTGKESHSQGPAQHFNGVFFMTGMNTPQRYPKPDITAALQARRVTKNVERLEAAFANQNDSSNEMRVTNAASSAPRRERSRSNQQIYFGSNPALRFNANINSYTSPNVSAAQNVTKRTRSYTQGSKVTDLPSGLY